MPHHWGNITVNQIMTKSQYNAGHRDIDEMKKEWSGIEKGKEIKAAAGFLIKMPKARGKGQHLRPHRCQKKWPQQPWGWHWDLTAPSAHGTCGPHPDSSRYYMPRSPAGMPAAVCCGERERKRKREITVNVSRSEEQNAKKYAKTPCHVEFNPC